MVRRSPFFAMRGRVAALLISLAAGLWLVGCEFDATGSGLSGAPGLASYNGYGCACACGATQEVPAGVAAAADDASEASDGTVALGNNGLVLAQTADEPTLVGLRFQGLGLGPGSTVEQAYVQFTSGTGNAPPGASFALSIAAGADDAAETSTGTVIVGGAGLAFQAGELVGLRFTNVTVPPNAVVLSAHVQFTAAATQNSATPIAIRGEKVADATPFAAVAGNLSSRLKTSASVLWSPIAWTAGDSGAPQRTVDVAELIEEISGEAGWSAGNSLVLLFEASMGGRQARSFEGAGAASLEITLGVAPEAATIAINGEATDDADPFAAAAFDLSGRTRTAATVMWEPDAWVDGEQGLDQRTNDLTDVIQAIIDEPGWTAGNSLALFFEDTTEGGDRIVAAFESGVSDAARLIVVALDPDGAELEFELSVCMPDDLNPNVEPNGEPSDDDLAADCEGRVNDSVQSLAVACGYAEFCACDFVPLDTPSGRAYDSSCDSGCTGEELEDDCGNFDPANGVKSATHMSGDDPVCLTATSDPPSLPPDALAAGFFGQVSECEVTGNAEILIDGLDDRSPNVTARLRIAGSPCPGGSCAVTASYLGAVGSFSYDGGFLGAGDTTISEVTISGSTTPDAVLLDASGLGEIPAGETASSGRGRRQTNRVIRDDIDVRESFIGENINAVEVGVDWEAATCFMDGPLFGGVIGDSDPDEDEEPTESDTTINFITDDGVLLNQPPSASATSPDEVECTSPAGALVNLDGAGSDDPDGNIAVARWNIDDRVGVAVGFGPAVGVPQALGVTSSYVHRVIDGFGQAGQDQLSVSVVDTTSPDLIEPEDLEVECLGPDGTPVHIGRGFAADRCDADVVVTNDAPALFPLGDTVVTWIATDDSGNQTVRMQTVTVTDTTPPEIEVELDPDSLWPPNHKMREIEATIEVFDVCDPDPTVALVSVASDEPDDDIADGATTGDIQGAAFGTDDRIFEVRSERQGKGDGRVYTATYEASDGSGNSANDSDEVQVAKSQGK